MSVDLSKIKPGDEVLVRLYVTEIDAHDVFLTTRAGGNTLVDAPVNAISSHTPKPLAVGDLVHVKPSAGACGRPKRVEAAIIGVHGKRAWLTDIEGDYWTAPLSDLERADA